MNTYVTIHGRDVGNPGVERWNEGYVMVLWPSGKKKYLLNGHLHRIDGPAVIQPNDPDWKKRWYVNGIRYVTNSSFKMAAQLSEEEMFAMVLKYEDVE